MALLISTNMYKAEELSSVFFYLDRFPGRLGVEIFPMFHEAGEEAVGWTGDGGARKTGYEAVLEACLPRLKKVPVSFHGPYYGAEHSAAPGTPDYVRTVEMTARTLEYAQALDSRYMVYHHNNCHVTDGGRGGLVRQACGNFREIETMSEMRGVPLVVENAGVMDRGNMLLGEGAFIDLCKKEQYKVLVDIGHAHANGWDLERVMEELREQIIAYHLHNNDGIHDCHRRIWDGTLDFDSFLETYRRLTPGADMVLEYSPDAAGDREGISSDIERLLRLGV